MTIVPVVRLPDGVGPVRLTPMDQFVGLAVRFAPLLALLFGKRGELNERQGAGLASELPGGHPEQQRHHESQQVDPQDDEQQG